MTTICINTEWYNDIKNYIKTEDPYFFNENGWDKVEVDVNEEEFNRVSIARGWI